MAQISEITGNIFTSSCEVVTVTVNCVGVMGAGIAKECRIRHPELYKLYADHCENRLLAPGKLLLWKSRILCFPTKIDWKHPSRMDFLVAGLDKLAATYQARGIRSIAMPHLGCSHGGLKPPVFDRQPRDSSGVFKPLHQLTGTDWRCAQSLGKLPYST